jgi:hypothetical protein
MHHSALPILSSTGARIGIVLGDKLLGGLFHADAGTFSQEAAFTAARGMCMHAWMCVCVCECVYLRLLSYDIAQQLDSLKASCCKKISLLRL